MKTDFYKFFVDALLLKNVQKNKIRNKLKNMTVIQQQRKRETPVEASRSDGTYI